MPPDQLPLLPNLLLPSPLRALAVCEVTAVLEQAIRAGAAGCLSHHGDLFMASICARVLAERLELAGLVVVEPSRSPQVRTI